MKPFAYLRDPLFLACVAAYFVNAYVCKAIWTSGFVHAYFNDLICIPFWLPIMLVGQRLLGLRRRAGANYDGPPTWDEILIPLVIWSWIFEVILPHSAWAPRGWISDPWDVAAYSGGAVLAGVFWQWRYGKETMAEGMAVAK